MHIHFIICPSCALRTCIGFISMDAFIACLQRFISRRGKPTLLWSDHGTNFVGAAGEIKKLIKFLESQKARGEISTFCSVQNIQWKFIPQHAPHFGGLWEAAVKSFKSLSPSTPSYWQCETNFRRANDSTHTNRGLPQ